MALESVFAIAPPLVGEKNKDTKNDDMESGMENEASDDGLEDEDLEEGEILDSDGEDKPDEKSGNAQQPNGISGQTGALQPALGNSVKRKIADVGDQDGAEGLLKKSKAPLYIDHDQVLEEDDWTSGVTFPLKKRSEYEEYLADVKWKLMAMKRKDGQFSASDGSPNEDGERRSVSPTSLKAKKKSRKLGSLCRIKVKKSGGKSSKKRKPESKTRLLRQKRDLKHNRPVCKFFVEGKCAKGSDCQFYHPPPHPRKKELCKFYLSGHCAKGKHCHFMHEEFPCKFYHTGAVCYSKESCRFSHKPLTEETKLLLDKHLHGSSSRQDDDDMDEDYYHERSKSHERPEPKVKRPCLLGSPPRHIREAAETKQWQEEMKKLQHQSKVAAFEIHSPIKEVPPSKFSRPNFYTDTLSPSPRRRMSGDVSDSVPSSKSYDVLKQPYPDLVSDDCDKDWTSICDMVNKLSPSRNDMSASDKAVNSDQEMIHIKSEGRDTPELSENVEHNEEFEKSPPGMIQQQDFHNSESEVSVKQENDKAESPKNRTPVHIPERCPSPDVTLPPINIPSHLPRIQRELFMRIHHNQKNMPSEQSPGSRVISDASDKLESIKTENESNEPTVKLEDSFYSSEEEDDDGDIDQPLTNVLRKLDEKPCPKDKESPPPINIFQMIKSIGQKSSEKPQTSAYHETEAFWQNILSSSATPVPTPAVVTTPTVNQSSCTIESTPQSPNESGTPDICPDLKKIIPEIKPSIPRDPRLQSREQRKPVREFPSFPSPPTLTMEENISTFKPLVDPKIGSQFPNKFRDIGLLQNPTPAVVVEGLQGLGSIPYKLHEVAASPPNYLSYIYASNYDTKLLSDPRLRKHIAQGSSTVHQLTLQSKGITLPNIPPPPLTALNSFNSDIVNPVSSEDSIGESVSSASEPIKSERKTHVIPRTRKSDSSGDSRHVLPGMVHAAMSEVAPARPPPHPVVPSPASHLPRAIADPRLAKLHHPLDPRRPRSMAERNSQRMSERKPAVVMPSKNTPNTSVEEKNNKGAVENVFPPETATKVELDGKNKRDTQESGSKKMDMCKNRKSSMSYSSPLNSYEDSVSSTTSGYNSYNQRPKRRMPNVPPVAETCAPVNDSAPKSPDFSVCDPSQLGNENPEVSTSLKEIFKTIDPAASPFC